MAQGETLWLLGYEGGDKQHKSEFTCNSKCSKVVAKLEWFESASVSVQLSARVYTFSLRDTHKLTTGHWVTCAVLNCMLSRFEVDKKWHSFSMKEYFSNARESWSTRVL